MTRPIVLRCNKQPYIVLSVLLVPVFFLGIYAAIHSGISENFVAPALILLMLGLIFYYFSSLTLALEDDKIIYREMFKSRNIFLNNILAIERGHGPFRTGVTWVLRCNDHTGPLVFNVTNFDSAGLHDFAKTLLARAPNIRFSAFKLKA